MGLSRRSGCAGDQLWLLLSSETTAQSATIHFGQVAATDTRLLAGNVVACSVPHEAPLGTTGVRLSVCLPGSSSSAATKHGAVSPGCSMRFEVLPPSE